MAPFQAVSGSTRRIGPRTGLPDRLPGGVSVSGLEFGAGSDSSVSGSELTDFDSLAVDADNVAAAEAGSALSAGRTSAVGVG